MLAPQETRTFFITSATWERRSILQSHPLCDLLLNVIRDNRAKARFQLHEFVFMRDHVHFMLTPAPQVSLEKAVQFIKGGFSFRAKKENLFNGEIWQQGYNESWIKNAGEYGTHVATVDESRQGGIGGAARGIFVFVSAIESGGRCGRINFGLKPTPEGATLPARCSAGLKPSSPAEARGSLHTSALTRGRPSSQEGAPTFMWGGAL